MARVGVLLAKGFEEIEAVTVVDVLRRADIDVWTLGVSSISIAGAHGIVVEADALLSEEADTKWDAVVCPGGLPGAHHLRDDQAVQRLLRAQDRSGRWIGAICAAPIALAKAGILRGRNVTCYPGFEDELEGANVVEAPVVIDRNLITSRGPATALAFAFALVNELGDKKIAESLKISTLYSELMEGL